MINLGILQGRLSQSRDGRFQFFPADWQNEFGLARDIGFSSIQWLFDWPEADTNPIFKKVGREEIIAASSEAGVAVSSICADYYMKHSLIGKESDVSESVLKKLIEAAETTSEKLVVVPILEGLAPRNQKEKEEIFSQLGRVLPVAEKADVRVALETEMTAKQMKDEIDRIGSKSLGVCYDIGNATSYGFDCPADIRFLGDKVFEIHAKDRKINSTQSVTLGDGDADYKNCLPALKDIGFNGTIVMQAWRGENYLKDAREQFLFLKNLL